MQTTSATSTGHTDLLSGILKVQVRNEEKITEQDRIYCQNQQDELYKTLDQIAWWYNIFKREAEKYEGKIKLKHEPNGKITLYYANKIHIISLNRSQTLQKQHLVRYGML